MGEGGRWGLRAAFGVFDKSVGYDGDGEEGMGENLVTYLNGNVGFRNSVNS